MPPKVSTSDHYLLECVECQRQYSDHETVTSCLHCGSALDVIYFQIKGKKDFPEFSSGFDFLEFAHLLPLKEKIALSLGEGNTPFLKAKKLGKKFGIKNLYVKYEGANPTGVFKDRGTAVEISKAKEMGAKAVCCASTGNMAASVAAYSAKAEIPCYVLIPETTPLGKLSQAIAYGAKTIKVRGSYKDCVRLSIEMAKHYGFYLAGDYAIRLEGQKSVSYELFLQMGKECPDWIVVPVGCGTHLAAIHKGFSELHEFGLIDRIPKFLAVQPENIPTIVDAWRQQQVKYVRGKYTPSIASAVGIEEPLDDIKVLRALYNSNGFAETVSEQEITAAQSLLGQEESLFVEPSAALPVAVLSKIQEQKLFEEDDRVVLFITGTGLKDPQSILSSRVDSPVLEPTLNELERYFSSGISEESAMLDTEDTEQENLWTEFPSSEELRTTVKDLFGIKLEKNPLANLSEMLETFHEKEKLIRRGDLKYAVENVLKMSEGVAQTLQVLDFSVQAMQHKPPEAWVLVSFNGEKIEKESKGVGPVDAIVSAIQDAIFQKDTIRAKLSHYAVEINTKGADAVVEVRLGLKAPNGLEVTGEAISPDIIVASVRAFENAYNLLHWKISQKT